MSADEQTTGEDRFTPQRDNHQSPFGQAVDSMRATAQTPNQQVYGEVRGWYDIRIGFVPNYAERVGDAEVEAQLNKLARLLFASRTRGYYALVEEHLQPDPGQLSSRRTSFEAALEDKAVTGSAGGSMVEVSAVGMRHWTVSIARGSVARFGGEGLAAECTRAANSLVTEWLAVLAAYKRERWERSA